MQTETEKGKYFWSLYFMQVHHACACGEQHRPKYLFTKLCSTAHEFSFLKIGEREVTDSINSYVIFNIF